MKLADAGFGGLTIFKKITGAKFRGRITTKTGVASSANVGLLEQFALLSTRPNSNVAAGDVFTADTGQTFLVARRMNHYEAGTVSKTFNLIPMNTLATWQQYSATTSNVTGIQTGSTYTNHPTTPNIWCMIQPSGTMIDGLYVPRDTYEIITGYPVKEKDKINGLVLSRVTQQLGIYVAEGK